MTKSEEVLKKQLSALGMCMRAGKLLLGPDLICKEMRRTFGGAHGNGVALVIEASDTSENTHKKLSDKCAYYGVKLIRLSADMGMLSGALGKMRSVAAVAITDKDLCRLFLSTEEKEEK